MNSRMCTFGSQKNDGAGVLLGVFPGIVPGKLSTQVESEEVWALEYQLFGL